MKKEITEEEIKKQRKTRQQEPLTVGKVVRVLLTMLLFTAVAFVSIVLISGETKRVAPFLFGMLGFMIATVAFALLVKWVADLLKKIFSGK